MVLTANEASVPPQMGRLPSITRIGLLANPAAGEGHALRIADEIANEAALNGVEVSLVTLDFQSSIESFLDDLIARIQTLVVIGGDGSFHYALQKLARTELPVYVIPAGTGNDFALTNNASGIDPVHIVHRILHEEPTRVDLGRVVVGNSELWFGQVLSTGFDSRVNRRANSMRAIKGKIKYTIATLLELPRFNPITYRIATDTEVFETRAMLVSIANGPTYGGGMKIVPDADRHDGYLDIMVLAEVSKIELLRVFPKVFSGAHKDHPAVSFYRTKTFSLQAAALAYADGEFVGDLPIHGEIHAGALLTWEER